MTIALSIPSPDQGVWHLGPVPLRVYAWCLIAGVAAADPSNEILGLRLNEWTSLVLFVAGLAYLVVAGRRAAESDPSEAWFVADRDADSRDKARS